MKDGVVQNKDQVQDNGHTPMTRVGGVAVERNKINYAIISKRKP